MFSEPALGEKFFGREDVLKLLNRRALALKDGYRQNVALTGQSLVGKSSVILYFLQTISEEGFVPVYVEVVKEGFGSFSNKFIATTLYNALRKMGVAVDIRLSELLKKAEEVLPKTSLAIRNIYSNIERKELDEAYSNLLGLTSVLKGETGLSCIVILDEFDNLECLGIKNPFSSFGKVIMVQKDTMYIVSSSRNNAIRKIISEKLSLLFGNFEVVKISNFDSEESGRYIDLKLANFDVDLFVRKFLMAFTDGNPFYLDKIVGRAKYIAVEQMSSHIDSRIIARAVLDLVYNANGVIHQYLLGLILDLLETKSRDSFVSILIAIAGGHKKQSEIGRALKTKKAEVAKGLAALVELGLVSKNGIFYKIDDVMLEFWLRFVYQRRRDLLVDGAFDKMELFLGDAKAYIDSFRPSFDKDPSSVISELFNTFSNELVHIESKHIRLPHFTKVERKDLGGSRPFIACSFRGNYWMVQVYEGNVNENDIIDYIRNVKRSGCKLANKIIIPLKGMDENAKLLAKELRIHIWNRTVINNLLNFYGMKTVVVL